MGYHSDIEFAVVAVAVVVVVAEKIQKLVVDTSRQVVKSVRNVLDSKIDLGLPETKRSTSCPRSSHEDDAKSVLGNELEPDRWSRH